MKFKSGDIILISRTSFLDKIIRIFMNIFQKDQVVYGHALIAKNEKEGFEADWKIKISDLNHVLNNCCHYKIIRYKNLTQYQIEVMTKSLSKLIGLNYGFKRLILQIFDHIFNTNWYTKLDKSS